MAAFKLTLTKIDTGDVLVDEEIDCLIGAAAIGDDQTCKLLFSECSTFALAAANVAVHKVINMLESKTPIVKHLTGFAIAVEDEKKEEEPSD